MERMYNVDNRLPAETSKQRKRKLFYVVKKKNRKMQNGGGGHKRVKELYNRFISGAVSGRS